jgi:outer membrane protein, heavy metal efflux system
MRKQNMKVPFPVIFILAVCLIPTPGFCQEPQVVQWADIEALLDQHPTLAATQSEVDAAKAGIRLSRQYPNPEVGVSYGRAEALEGDESAIVWGVEVEIPIDKPGTYINESRASKANWKAAKSEAVMARRGVVRQIKALFFQASIGWERVDSLHQSREQMKQLVDTARLRVTHGEAPPTELTRLEIEFEKVDMDFIEAKQKLGGIHKSLDIWLGGKLPDLYRVQADWTKLPSLPNLETTLNSIEAEHPELYAAKQRILAANSYLRVERNRLLPDLKIGGFYDVELDARAYGGMVAMEVPLWNWNIGGMKKAKAERSAAKHRKVYVIRKLIDSVQEEYTQSSLLIERARRYRDSIVPKARETAKAHERLYKLGETSVMDLLDARRSLIETETEMQDAFLEGWLAYLNLIALIGENNA